MSTFSLKIYMKEDVSICKTADWRIKSLPYREKNLWYFQSKRFDFCVQIFEKYMKFSFMRKKSLQVFIWEKDSYDQLILKKGHLFFLSRKKMSFLSVKRHFCHLIQTRKTLQICVPVLEFASLRFLFFKRSLQHSLWNLSRYSFFFLLTRSLKLTGFMLLKQLSVYLQLCIT